TRTPAAHSRRNAVRSWLLSRNRTSAPSARLRPRALARVFLATRPSEGPGRFGGQRPWAGPRRRSGVIGRTRGSLQAWLLALRSTGRHRIIALTGIDRSQ